MNIYDICSPKYYQSEKPYVAGIWNGLHQKLFIAKGRAFEFDILIQNYEFDYKWQAGLFTAGKWIPIRHRESVGSWSQANEAMAVYKPLLSNYTITKEVTYDSRPSQPTSGATGREVYDQVLRVQVPADVSSALYNMYRQEAEQFRDRVRSHGLQLWRVSPLDAHSSVRAKKDGDSPARFDGQVTPWEISYSHRPYSLKFSNLGMANLSTLQQCYGMLLAMLDEALPAMEKLGNVELRIWGTSNGQGNQAFPAMGYCFLVTPGKPKLNQW